jgi:4-aminobutyrate---pyruvate transaminase
MRGHPNSISARDMEYVLHPVTNARKHEEIGPIVIDRGEGVYVYDDQGNQYIEALAGLWSVAVGFGEKRLVEAASRQMAKLPYSAGREAGEDDARPSQARFLYELGFRSE